MSQPLEHTPASQTDFQTNFRHQRLNFEGSSGFGHETQNIGDDSEEYDDDEEDAVEVVVSKTGRGRSKGKSVRAPSIEWTIPEDTALAWAYIRGGGDTGVGTYQRKDNLWVTIVNLYEQARKESPNRLTVRNLEACNGRWKRTQRQINKWVGEYDKAERLRKSGWSEDDVLTLARTLFAKAFKTFKYEHMWNILKHYPKWQAGLKAPVSETPESESGGSSKRSNSEVPTSNDIDGDVSYRPPGSKRLKSKGKSQLAAESLETITKSIADLNKMRECEQEFDKKRLDLQTEMFEYQKLRDEEKRAEKEARRKEKEAKNLEKLVQRRFQMYTTLLAKSTLTPTEMEMFNKLNEEFKIA